MVSLNRPPSPEPIDPPNLRPSSSRLVAGLVIQRPTPSSSPSPSLGLEPLPSRRPPLSPIPFARSPSPNLLPESDAPDSPSFDTEYLVRTAQASRLRRRGAIRIENRQRGDTVAPAGPPPGRRAVLLDEEDDEEGEEERRSSRPTLPFMLTRSVVPADFSGERSRLYCGGVPKRSRTTSSSRWTEDEPVWPSPFPSTEREPYRKKPRRVPLSTGCGELVCLGACASERIGVWLSDTPKLPKNVARMDEEYVDRGPGNVIKTGTSNCGCDHEGIGCRNCGNSLGMKIHHCHRHSELHASLAQAASRTSAPIKRRVAFVFNPLTVSHDPEAPVPFPFKLPEETRPNPDLMSLPPELLRMAPEELAPSFYRFMENHPADNSTPTTPTPPIATRRSRAPIAERPLPALIPAVLDMEPSRPVQLVPPVRPGWSVIRSPSSAAPPSLSSDPPRIIAAVRSMPSSSSGSGSGSPSPLEDRRRTRNLGSWGPPSLDDASSARLGSGLSSQCPTPPSPLNPPSEGEAASSSSRQLNLPIPTHPSPPVLTPASTQSSSQGEESHSEDSSTASASDSQAVFSEPVVTAIARLEAIRARLNALLDES